MDDIRVYPGESLPAVPALAAGRLRPLTHGRRRNLTGPVQRILRRGAHNDAGLGQTAYIGFFKARNCHAPFNMLNNALLYILQFQRHIVNKNHSADGFNRHFVMFSTSFASSALDIGKLSTIHARSIPITPFVT